MQAVTRSEAQLIIDENRDQLEHVDRRLDFAVRQAGQIFAVKLLTIESFLSLLWTPDEGADWLAPGDAPHTLKDVAGRLLAGEHDFETLADGDPALPADHDPKFFIKFPYLDENFEFGRMGVLALAKLGDDEQRRSPRANFFIYDGLRRSLVLARRLLTGESSYQPVSALLVIPRPL